MAYDQYDQCKMWYDLSEELVKLPKGNTLRVDDINGEMVQFEQIGEVTPPMDAHVGVPESFPKEGEKRVLCVCITRQADDSFRWWPINDIKDPISGFGY